MIALCTLAGCAVAPYEPGTIRLPPMPRGEAFARVAAVAGHHYRGLVLEPKDFRIRSGWCDCADGDAVGRRRLTLFLDGDRLCAVVEVSYLYLDWRHRPRWTSRAGHPRWERELLDEIEAALRS